jgi:chromosome segregation ATPase
MTTSKYLIARVAQTFGYVRRAHRMANAASEMHLLREAEAYLGEAVWEKVEGIEKLSVEYWNLRKLMKEKNAVQARMMECQAKLDQAHDKRSEVLNTIPQQNDELAEKRKALMDDLQTVALRRDRVISEARDVRRSYVGLKMKIEVLANERAGDESGEQDIKAAKEKIEELKNRFAALKQERIEVGRLIEEGDKKIDELDELLGAERRKRRDFASTAFQSIGECNKEMSLLRAESGLLDTQMRQLFGEIGRYVSRYSREDPSCAAVANSQSGMVDVMRALRRSVALNHRLAGYG